MGAGTKRRPSTRCATSNGLCGADRHYTGVCFEQPAHQPLSLFLVLLGPGLVAVLAAFVFTILLDAEIRVDDITYFDVACVASAIPFIVFPQPMIRGIGAIIEWRQRRAVCPGLQSRLCSALSLILFFQLFLLPSAIAMDESPPGAGAGLEFASLAA